ncbi:glycosyltransferase [Calycomorphotria hydatis]|nr:glycosyltransferase [Calycomorphotria hydatis]
MAVAPKVNPLFEPGPRGPIRVGFVMHAMQVAGAEVLVAETIRHYRDQLHPVIFCLDAIGQLGEELQSEGVEVVLLDRQPEGKDWGLPNRLAAAVREHNIELLHAHQYTPFYYSALARLNGAGGVKLIFTEHGRHFPDKVGQLRRWGNKLLLQYQAHRVNACCRFSAKALVQRDGFSASRVDVIPNGIQIDRYGKISREDARRKLDIPGETTLITCVARMHPVKDHATLLKAFAGSSICLDATLLLVGDGPERAKLEDLARSLHVADRVWFWGVRDDVPTILAASDLFVLNSISEAASLTLLEAMASRLAVVVTKVGGNPEIVRHNKDGILVRRKIPSETQQAIDTLLSDPQLRNIMGQKGRERVETEFQLHQTIKAYGQLYAELATEQSPDKAYGSSGWKQHARNIINGLCSILVLPVVLWFQLLSAFIGPDRTLENTSQLMALIPGAMGNVLRRAFLSWTIAECAATATVCFGTLFSKTCARLGEHVYVGPNCHLGDVDLKRDTLIAPGVQIPSGGNTHTFDDRSIPIREQQGASRKVTVGPDAWIGANAVVMDDVGRGAVVAAGSVVTSPVESFHVVAGVPAKTIRIRGEEPSAETETES